MGSRIRHGWPVVLAVAVVALVALQLVAPHYNQLQTANNAAAFRRALGAPGRAIAATAFDDLFALAYGTLGLIGIAVVLRPGRWRGVAAVLVALAATLDIVENALLATNVVARHTITDAWVLAMRVPGTLKWIGSPVLLIVLVMVIARAIKTRAALAGDTGVS